MSATDGLLAQVLREEAVRWSPGSRAASTTSTWPRRPSSRRWSRRSLLAARRSPGQPGRLAAGGGAAQRHGRRTPEHPAARPRRAGRPAGVPGSGTDDRLALLFACCHPALAPEARLALTLRAVVGLTTPQIARAFLAPRAPWPSGSSAPSARSPTRASRWPSRHPTSWPSGWATCSPSSTSCSTRGSSPRPAPTQDRDLAADAVWLADVVATAVPDEPEAWGLAALLTIQHARAAARFDAGGGIVLLRQQDRSRWDHAAIAEGEAMIERAAALHRPGRYQLQAAIAAVHATAPSWEETDWLQIVVLYDVLAGLDPSPVVRLNQAVARAQLGEPEQAAGPARRARRPARVVPPLPRLAGGAAHRARAARRGPRGEPDRPRAHHQRRRAAAADDAAAPLPAGGRHVAPGLGGGGYSRCSRTTRVVNAGSFASRAAGRTGRGSRLPPQLGQTPCRACSTQSRHQVHS